MTDACAKNDPLEACGVIAGGVVYELPNHARFPESTFLLRAEDIYGAVAPHGGYDAVWHTHPSGNPVPSPDDWAYHPRAKFMVIATREDVNVYFPEDPS